MRLIKFTVYKYDTGCEDSVYDVFINPEQVLFVKESSERPGYAYIKLVEKYFIANEGVREVVSKLRYAP